MKQRLFAALDLPTLVRDALAVGAKRLRTALPQNSVRWVRPDGIHLTLRFFGDTQPELVPALQAALARSVSGLGPVELELDDLGVFPNAVAPRVIWVGLRGALEVLQTLQQRLESEARALGFRPETRPFTPHLTLGRVNQLRAPEKQKLAQLLKERVVSAPGPFVLDQLSLIKSDLKPMGAIYTPLGSAWLRAGRPLSSPTANGG